MAESPERRARAEIDRLLAAADWAVQDYKAADIHAARGVAIREFVLDAAQGFADYLLYVDGKAAGVIEAKKQGATLAGEEIQSQRYAQGVAVALSGEGADRFSAHAFIRSDLRPCMRAERPPRCC